MKGHLLKKEVNGEWKRKFCEIKDAVLYVFKNSKQDKLLSVIVLNTGKIGNIRMTDEIKDEQGHGVIFEIDLMEGRFFALRAPNAEKAEAWVAELSTARDQPRTDDFDISNKVRTPKESEFLHVADFEVGNEEVNFEHKPLQELSHSQLNVSNKAKKTPLHVTKDVVPSDLYKKQDIVKIGSPQVSEIIVSTTTEDSDVENLPKAEQIESKVLDNNSDTNQNAQSTIPAVYLTPIINIDEQSSHNHKSKRTTTKKEVTLDENMSSNNSETIITKESVCISNSMHAGSQPLVADTSLQTPIRNSVVTIINPPQAADVNNNNSNNIGSTAATTNGSIANNKYMIDNNHLLKTHSKQITTASNITMRFIVMFVLSIVTTSSILYGLSSTNIIALPSSIFVSTSSANKLSNVDNSNQLQTTTIITPILASVDQSNTLYHDESHFQRLKSDYYRNAEINAKKSYDDIRNTFEYDSGSNNKHQQKKFKKQQSSKSKNNDYVEFKIEFEHEQQNKKASNDVKFDTIDDDSNASDYDDDNYSNYQDHELSRKVYQVPSYKGAIRRYSGRFFRLFGNIFHGITRVLGNVMSSIFGF